VFRFGGLTHPSDNTVKSVGDMTRIRLRDTIGLSLPGVHAFGSAHSEQSSNERTLTISQLAQGAGLTSLSVFFSLCQAVHWKQGGMTTTINKLGCSKSIKNTNYLQIRTALCSERHLSIVVCLCFAPLLKPRQKPVSKATHNFNCCQFQVFRQIRWSRL